MIHLSPCAASKPLCDAFDHEDILVMKACRIHVKLSVGCKQHHPPHSFPKIKRKCLKHG